MSSESPQLEVQLAKLIRAGEFSKVSDILKKMFWEKIGQEGDDSFFDEDSLTVLHWIVYHRLPNLIPIVLEKNPSLLNVRTTSNEKPYETALEMALKSSQYEAAEVLIKAGSDLNIPNHYYKETPLHTASRLGLTYLVALLIEKGADIKMITRYGDTAFSLALRNKNFDTAQCLISAGATFNFTTSLSDEDLHFLSSPFTKDRLVLLPTFLFLGLNPEAIMSEGKSFIDLAPLQHRHLISILPTVLPLFSPGHMQMIANIIIDEYIKSHPGQKIMPGEKFLKSREDVDKLLEKHLPNALSVLFDKYNDLFEKGFRSLMKDSKETKDRKDTKERKQDIPYEPKTLLEQITETESQEVKLSKEDEIIFQREKENIRNTIAVMIRDHLKYVYLSHDMVMVMAPFIQRELAKISVENAQSIIPQGYIKSLVNIITELSFASLDAPVQGFSSDPKSPFSHEKAVERANTLKNIYVEIAQAKLIEAGFKVESKIGKELKHDQKEEKEELKEYVKPLLKKKELEDAHKQKEEETKTQQKKSPAKKGGK